MQPITYRRATVADVPALVELRTAFVTELGRGDQVNASLLSSMGEYFGTKLAAGQFISEIAETGGRIVACSGMVYQADPPSPARPSGRGAYIMNMYTQSDLRRRGIAAALLARLIDAAREAGCERVSLHALPLGQSIYTKAGFKRADSEMVLKLAGAPGMSDEELLRQFESCALPFNRWTHRAHVKVAYLCLRQHPFEQALVRLRAGIQRFNAHNHVPDSATSGYNETTTHAFLHLIDAVMRSYGDAFATPDADSFCDTHPQLLTRHALRLFYSPQRRMHPQAKAQFIEPDLAPLPRIL